MVDIEKENGYGNILKRISAFGGVQVFNILVNLVRGKFVAMFLGPEGMGISSLFTSSTATLQQFAGLGLNLALVKEIASCRDDRSRLATVMNVVLRLILLTSLLGAVACACLSPLLSKWTFGTYGYTLGFVILSLSVGLSIAGSGFLAILQGMSEVRRLSKASLVGSLTGLICGVPLYYFFGTRGIVPAMVILAFTVFLFYYISYRKSVRVDKAELCVADRRPLARKLLSLGLVLMLGSLSGTLTNYLINAFIRYMGSVEVIGLFQAANSVTNQYVGVVFSALALDYFPRLSAVCKDRQKMCDVVNRQSEVVIIIVTPLVLLLILTTPLVIRILLTDQFLMIIPLMRWLGLGVLLQAVSFPLGYIFVANDNRKVYVWLEIVLTNLLWIGCSVLFFYLLGLIGLGVSLVARMLIDIPVTYTVCRRTYGFAYSARVWRVNIFCLLAAAAGFALTIPGNTACTIVLCVLTAASIIVSFVILRRRLRE